MNDLRSIAKLSDGYRLVDDSTEDNRVYLLSERVKLTHGKLPFKYCKIPLFHTRAGRLEAAKDVWKTLSYDLFRFRLMFSFFAAQIIAINVR